MECSSQIEWIKYLTFVLTIFGMYITYQQYKINHYKIQLDLYEKRYKVVQGYKSAIASLVKHGNLTQDELRDFIISTKEATYLFDKNIIMHLDEVYKKFLDIQFYKTELKENSELEQSQRSEYANNSAEILKYFYKLLKETDEKYFKKYLDFTKLS
ncbi:MAG: hypothetical protein Q8N01_04465 [Sulfuricurvum sp.]|nr:hypothetical protein [Sulfuricurvum sp.]